MSEQLIKEGLELLLAERQETLRQWMINSPRGGPTNDAIIEINEVNAIEVAYNYIEILNKARNAAIVARQTLDEHRTKMYQP